MGNIAPRLGIDHYWLQTDTKSAGLGPAGGGPLPDYPIGASTMITDHTGEIGKKEEVDNVDEECVNKKLMIGQLIGKWGQQIIAKRLLKK